jgi:hypothetical protein
MSNRSLVAALIADFDKQLAGIAPVAYGVGTDSSLYAVVSNTHEARTEQRGRLVISKTRLSAPADYNVLCWREGRIDCVTIRDVSVVVSLVQPMPNGILLVGSRCRWSPQGAELNGVVADRSGHIVQEMTLGDGIEDVRVTPSGTIWISYFDEGVCGNFGWGNPGPEPIGRSGLVAFTPQGDIWFSYNPSAAHTDEVTDVYAMNVASTGEVWGYFYTDFPIVRIINGGYTKWDCGVEGAKGIAVASDRVLLVGDYDSPALARVLRLGTDGIATSIEELSVVDDSGKPIRAEKMYGTGRDLYLFKGPRVWVLKTW